MRFFPEMEKASRRWGAGLCSEQQNIAITWWDVAPRLATNWPPEATRLSVASAGTTAILCQGLQWGAASNEKHCYPTFINYAFGNSAGTGVFLSASGLRDRRKAIVRTHGRLLLPAKRWKGVREINGIDWGPLYTMTWLKAQICFGVCSY